MAIPEIHEMYDTEQVGVERIQGAVERVTFHNPENGFSVLRVKVEGHQDKVYGKQFKAHQGLKSIPPNTLEGLEKYLGSGLIKGIGANTAKVLIKNFGEEVLTVLENEPDRFMVLSGIGTKRKKQILSSWASNYG